MHGIPCAEPDDSKRDIGEQRSRCEQGEAATTYSYLIQTKELTPRAIPKIPTTKRTWLLNTKTSPSTWAIPWKDP